MPSHVHQQGVVGATQTAAAFTASTIVVHMGPRHALFAAVSVQVGPHTESAEHFVAS